MENESKKCDICGGSPVVGHYKVKMYKRVKRSTFDILIHSYPYLRREVDVGYCSKCKEQMERDDKRGNVGCWIVFAVILLSCIYASHRLLGGISLLFVVVNTFWLSAIGLFIVKAFYAVVFNESIDGSDMCVDCQKIKDLYKEDWAVGSRPPKDY